MFKPIQTKTASSEISDQIKEMILQGQLQPGDRLPSERELAEKFKVSRTTVREALRSLAAIGIISIRQGDGSFVEHFKLEDVLEPLSVLFHIEGDESGLEAFSEVREILEVEMVALAAKRADKEDLDVIERSVGAMVDEVKNGGIGDLADADFHVALANASKNPVLIRLMNTIADLMKYTYQSKRKRLFLDQEILEEIYRSHHAVAQAVREKNPEKSRIKMREHLRMVKKRMDEIAEIPIDFSDRN